MTIGLCRDRRSWRRGRAVDDRERCGVAGALHQDARSVGRRSEHATFTHEDALACPEVPPFEDALAYRVGDRIEDRADRRRPKRRIGTSRMRWASLPKPCRLPSGMRASSRAVSTSVSASTADASTVATKRPSGENCGRPNVVRTERDDQPRRARPGRESRAPIGRRHRSGLRRSPSEATHEALRRRAEAADRSRERRASAARHKRRGGARARRRARVRSSRARLRPRDARDQGMFGQAVTPFAGSAGSQPSVQKCSLPWS